MTGGERHRDMPEHPHDDSCDDCPQDEPRHQRDGIARLELQVVRLSDQIGLLHRQIISELGDHNTKGNIVVAVERLEAQVIRHDDLMRTNGGLGVLGRLLLAEKDIAEFKTERRESSEARRRTAWTVIAEVGKAIVVFVGGVLAATLFNRKGP